MSDQLGATLLQVLPFALTLLFLGIALKRGKIDSEATGLCAPRSWKHYIIWISAFFLYALSADLLLYQKGLLEIHKWHYPAGIAILRGFGAVLLAPLTEEILLRGILLSLLLKKGIPSFPAIIIQSLLFVALHASVYDGSGAALLGISQIFTDGILFGLARKQTGSLLTSITMHMLANSIAIAERLL